MCGGTNPVCRAPGIRDGLSPRVRGNRADEGHHRAGHRSIPACAGEPSHPGRPAAPSRVYPRVCGGTCLQLLLQLPSGGLSPRVRGNRKRRQGIRIAARSIPACAGEPERLRRGPAWARVYPRVCGGTDPKGDPSGSLGGLSPRVRGNPSPTPSQPLLRRSIPACAGEPRRQTSVPGAYQVYPRVCGGTGAGLATDRQRAGLSPRVRGNRVYVKMDIGGVRSIPACAGEPGLDGLLGGLRRVYPRVCGGTRRRRPRQRTGDGLSPRVRGNRSHCQTSGRSRRSIPACAGEPGQAPPGLRVRGVYPRVCGGTVAALYRRPGVQGLSPRVRGNRGKQKIAQYLCGSIPACAGEPPLWRLRHWRTKVYPRVCGGTPPSGSL